MFIRREVQNERVRQLKIQEDELDEKKRKEDEERRVPLPESLYAQPVVVQTKLVSHILSLKGKLYPCILQVRNKEM